MKKIISIIISLLLTFSFFSCGDKSQSGQIIMPPKLENRYRVQIINGSGSGLYESNTEITIIAKVASGYKFVNWTDGKEVISLQNPFTFIVDKDVSLTAVVSQKQDTLNNVNVIIQGGDGSGDYSIGSLVTANAKPPEKLSFVYWKDNFTEAVVSTKQKYTFKAQKQTNLVAVFVDNNNLPDANYYTNPVLKSDRPDPSIIRADGKFYMYTTAKTIPNLSTSKDLINWSTESLNKNFIPYEGTSGSGTWAPDIVKIGDTYNLYYSRSTWGDVNPGIGVSTSKSPIGPWENHGKLLDSAQIGVNNSIDPTVFVGQDGKVYMIWGSFRGIFGIELTADGLGFKSGSVIQANATKTLVAGIVGNWDGLTYEAPYVIFKDGFYYMFVSLGTCCEGANSTYRVKVSRSENPLGPYVDENDSDMLGRNKGYLVLDRIENTIVGPGHNSIVVDDIGQYWIVYHLYFNDNGTYRGRWIGIDKLVWSDDGWPAVKDKVSSVTRTKGPVFL